MGRSFIGNDGSAMSQTAFVGQNVDCVLKLTCLIRHMMRLLPVAIVLVLAGTGCTSARQPSATPVMATPSAAPATDLLPVRYDAATGRTYLTVPRLGEEMLYMNTLATGLGTTSPLLDRGQVGSEAVVRFERRGNRVLLMQQNTFHRADAGDEALRRSVDESFPQTVLAAFSIQAEGPGGLVVDATDFFLTDVFDVAGHLRSARLGNVRVDRDRSYIDGDRTRTFGENTEVRAVLSFVTDDPAFELRRHTADGRSFTMQQQHSFVRLPDPPMPVRAFDPRAGIFANTFFDFSQPFDSDYLQRSIVRWRLEPSDPEAYLRGEQVEPVKPIVYYLDPGIPEPYRSAFVEGGLWFNDLFGSAGWKDAFRIEPLPEGVDAMDARYPVIYWVHRQQRGPSVGPSFRDPRTGEILNTVVRMDSYRSLVNNDIYMGLLPAAGEHQLQMTAEEFAMARRRQHSAHEIGHTLGMAHNFIAATQGRASVMDYPYPLIELDAEGRIDISRAYRPSAGAHDTLAIRYAYTWYPSPDAEAAGLREIIREAERRGLRFIADAHAPASQSYPAVSQWVEGSDMLAALERTVAVRRVLVEHFNERAARPGEPLAVLNRRFAHVYLHHRYALVGATKYIGGMEFGYALRGEETEPTRVIPPAEQRRALAAVLATVRPEELRIPDRIISLLPPVPFGFDGDLIAIQSPAGNAFDPVAAAHSLAMEIVEGLLHPTRLARVATFRRLDAGQMSVDEVMATLIESVFRADRPRDLTDAALRRVTERSVVDGLLDLAGHRAATTEVRSVAEQYLQHLAERLAPARGLEPADRAHRETAVRDIERYFRGEDSPERRPRPERIALPWP
jgi:hypothetical protein